MWNTFQFIKSRVVNLKISFGALIMRCLVAGLNICIAVLVRPIMRCRLLVHSVKIYSCHGRQQSMMEPPHRSNSDDDKNFETEVWGPIGPRLLAFGTTSLLALWLRAFGTHIMATI